MKGATTIMESTQYILSDAKVAPEITKFGIGK
jgi:hypothetical protein